MNLTSNTLIGFTQYVAATVIFFICFSTPAVAQVISGENSVSLDDEVTYYYLDGGGDDAIISDFDGDGDGDGYFVRWLVPENGTEISRLGQQITIKWSTAGTGKVKAQYHPPGHSSPLTLTKDIEINDESNNINLPNTPPTPTVGSSSCNSGSPYIEVSAPQIFATDVYWYWQGKDSNGTNTANMAWNPDVSGGIYPYTVTDGDGRYYLRAKNNDGWSTASSFVDIVVTTNGGTISGNQTICAGDNPTVITGTGSADYRWYSRVPSQSTDWSIISGATAASYTPSLLSVTTEYRRATLCGGQEGLSNTIAITVSPSLEAPDVSKTQPTCGVATGQITVTPPSGNGFTYSFDNGATFESSNTKNNLAPDNYKVRIKNSAGCVSPATEVSITAAPATITGVTVSMVEPSCTSLGSITVTAPKGELYEYSFDGGNTYQSSNTMLGLSGGTYNILVKRFGYCTSSKKIVQLPQAGGQHDTPTLSAVTQPTCAGEMGMFTITNLAGTSYGIYDQNDNVVSTTVIDYTTGIVSVPAGSYKVRNETPAPGQCPSDFSELRTVPVGSPMPNAPAVSSQEYCGAGNITLPINYLTEVSGSRPTRFKVYDENSNLLETLVAEPSGSTDFTIDLQATSQYGFSALINGCEGPITMTTLTIGTAPTWYLNADGDGYAASETTACDRPGSDWTTDSLPLGDCNDDKAEVHPDTIWRLDADGDGHALAGATVQACEPPGQNYDDYTYEEIPEDDCDDTIFNPSNNCDTENPSSTTFGENYVYTRTYQTERGTPTDFFESDDGLVQNITYFDGLGRPIQQIGISQSPSQKDIITHIGYDDYGRMEKEWLPVPAPNGTIGSYRTENMEEATRNYYEDPENYGDDFPNLNGVDVNPYSEKLFEPSPLNRVLKQAAPGEDWRMGNGHEIAFDYQANATNEVRFFDVTTTFADNTYTPTLVLGEATNGSTQEYYNARELYKTITYDENYNNGKNHSTEEFTDKQGRVVLKRTYADITNADGSVSAEEPHDTYYVYDDFGNLTYVLPPKMNASTATLQDITGVMKDLGYQYVYDNRNRLVEKSIPGKEKEYIVYNKLDQPIMTQDANMRSENNSSITLNQWLFTKYDAFGRVTYTGKVTDGRERPEVQNSANNVSGNLWVNRGSYTNGGINIGYENAAYPTTGITEVLTVNYYDDYYFDRGNEPTPPTMVFDENIDYRTKGLPTGSKVRVLNPSESSGQANWITSIIRYDAKGRVIYTYSENEYLSSVDLVTSQLDFVGRPLKVRSSHTKNGNTIVTIDNFTYDHVGRLLTQTQCIGNQTLGDTCEEGTNNVGVEANPVIAAEGNYTNSLTATNSITIRPTTTIRGTVTLKIDPSATGSNGTAASEELIVFNDYDKLGQLRAKKVGGSSISLDYAAITGLQTIDYKYNVRGWLTGINDVNTTDKLFNFSISYNQGTNALYNGNIAKTSWRTANDDSSLKSYDYTYDPLSRIIAATGGASNTNYDVSNISYDKNGNIQTLTRNGFQGNSNFTNMDVLDYDYDSGNKLLKVADTGNKAHGFKDGTNTNDDFEYDDNGNLEIDRNKGITNISYNFLNQPEQITFNNGNIQYVYDATGIKLKKSVSTTGTETEYSNGYIYENNVLQFFPHAEGYVEPDGSGGYDYIYNYTDHLGSVRLSYTDANNDGSIDPANEIIEENNHYPFGLQQKGYNNNVSSLGNSTAKKWKYANEEFEEDLGLNTVSYGRRDYDPTIGRFNKMDRFAEKYRSDNPYHFTLNNPILLREVQGDSVWVYNESINKVGRLGTHAFLRVKTDKVDVTIELTGQIEGGRTGRPAKKEFSKEWFTNGRGPVSDAFLVQPGGKNEDYAFENSILEFFDFFSEQDANGDYSNLPGYNFSGPNSNGFVVSLVKNAEGGVELNLGLRALGENDTEDYDRAIYGYVLRELRDNVCNSATCSDETLSNLDAIIERYNQQEEERKKQDEED